MAMSASSMAASIKGYIDAVPPVQGNATDINTYRTALLEALCQGIIEELIANAEIATTSGAPDSEHVGNITA